jgi:exonuclease RecJ-like protein
VARWPTFREAARAHFASTISPERFERVQEAEAELAIDDIDAELLPLLDRFEPHGMGNPRPVFATDAIVAGPWRELGATGVRGRLRTRAGELDCLCWNRDMLGSAAPGERIQVHYRLAHGRGRGIEAEILAATRQGKDATVLDLPPLPSTGLLGHSRCEAP